MKKILVALILLHVSTLPAMENQQKEQEKLTCLAAIELSCDHLNCKGTWVLDARQDLKVSLPQPDGSLQKIFNCYFSGTLSNGLPHEGIDEEHWNQSIKQTDEHKKLASTASSVMTQFFTKCTGKIKLLCELYSNETSSLFSINEKKEKTLFSEICAQEEERIHKKYETVRSDKELYAMYEEDEKVECENCRSKESKINTCLTDLTKKFLILCPDTLKEKAE